MNSSNRFVYPVSACMFLLAGMLFSLCDTGENDPPPLKTETVAGLKFLPGEVAGWEFSAEPDSFVLYTPSTLYLDIDGGDEVYKNHFVVEIADLHMEGPGDNALGPHTFLMDFGTDANAKAMYQYQYQMYASEMLTVTGFKKSEASATPVIGGIIAFAHFRKFYIELAFTGYTSNDDAIAAAATFFTCIHSKIE